MREVKYKAWDNVANKMYCVGDEELIVFIMKDGYIQAEQIIPDDSEQGYYVERLDHLKYLEYTGFKGKDGVEIFEGDVVEYCDFDSLRTGGRTSDNVIIGEIIFGCGTYMIQEANGQLHDLYVSLVNDEEFEIIGSVYENPELLNKS